MGLQNKSINSATAEFSPATATATTPSLVSFAKSCHPFPAKAAKDVPQAPPVRGMTAVALSNAKKFGHLNPTQSDESLPTHLFDLIGGLDGVNHDMCLVSLKIGHALAFFATKVPLLVAIPDVEPATIL